MRYASEQVKRRGPSWKRLALVALTGVGGILWSCVTMTGLTEYYTSLLEPITNKDEENEEL